MIVADACGKWAFTFDIIAAIGAAKNSPAAHGGSTDHQRGDHQIGHGEARQDGAAKSAGEMHAEHQNRHDDRANDNPAVHGFAVFIGIQRTAVCGRPITPKQTSTQNEVIKVGDRISSAPCGDTSCGSIPLQCVHRLMQAAGSMDDTNQQDDRPDQHHHSLHRIVEYAGAGSLRKRYTARW